MSTLLVHATSRFNMELRQIRLEMQFDWKFLPLFVLPDLKGDTFYTFPLSSLYYNLGSLFV